MHVSIFSPSHKTPDSFVMMGKGAISHHGELQNFIVTASTNIFSCINTVVHDSYLNMPADCTNTCSSWLQIMFGVFPSKVYMSSVSQNHRMNKAERG